MQSYESKQPAYFATPSPQLIRALHTSLQQILTPSPYPADQPSSASSTSPSTQPSTTELLSNRFAAHRNASRRVKDVIEKELGLQQLADRPENQANGMTAFYMPEGVQAADLLPRLAKKGVILAAGLHRDIKGRYARMGHMGISVVRVSIHLLIHLFHDLDLCFSIRLSQPPYLHLPDLPPCLAVHDLSLHLFKSHFV